MSGERLVLHFDQVACNFLLSPEGGTCGHQAICLKDKCRKRKVETMARGQEGLPVPGHYSLLIVMLCGLAQVPESMLGTLYTFSYLIFKNPAKSCLHMPFTDVSHSLGGSVSPGDMARKQQREDQSPMVSPSSQAWNRVAHKRGKEEGPALWPLAIRQPAFV